MHQMLHLWLLRDLFIRKRANTSNLIMTTLMTRIRTIENYKRTQVWSSFKVNITMFTEKRRIFNIRY